VSFASRGSIRRFAPERSLLGALEEGPSEELIYRWRMVLLKLVARSDENFEGPSLNGSEKQLQPGGNG
jgi:hypothetical protein